MPKKLTIQEVKDKIQKKHGDIITLDETTYTNTQVKAKFVDKKHGEWWAIPNNILRGKGHKNRLKCKREQTNLKRYGVKNVFQSPKIQKKSRKTFLKKYGVSYSIHSPEILKKQKQTNLERYGAEFTFGSPEIQKKSRQTCLERYGTENVSKLKSVQEKKKQTCMEKYGVESSFQSKEIQEKIKKTNLERYGVEYAIASEHVKKKKKETCMKKYGTEHPMQNPEIALRCAKSQKNSYILKHWKTNQEVICVAGYEKAVVEYLNENKIDYRWQHRTFKMTLRNGKETTYRPDLYLVGKKIPWVEIKGYFRNDAEEKWEIFRSQIKPNSQLWNKGKLKKIGIL